MSEFEFMGSAFISVDVIVKKRKTPQPFLKISIDRLVDQTSDRYEQPISRQEILTILQACVSALSDLENQT